MSTTDKIGTPIPLGIIERDSAVLGSGNEAVAPGATDQDAASQLATLRAELDALKAVVERAGKGALRTVEAHPLLTATAVSLGLWALIAVAYRRSRYDLSDIVPALRDRYSRWS